jgi:hypothetical protein
VDNDTYVHYYGDRPARHPLFDNSQNLGTALDQTIRRRALEVCRREIRGRLRWRCALSLSGPL